MLGERQSLVSKAEYYINILSQVVIPVDLRNDIASPKSSNKLGCKVASILATVPAGMESAIPRLWATRHRLEEVKASADPVVAYGATTVLMNLLPQSLGSSVLDSITNKVSVRARHSTNLIDLIYSKPRTSGTGS